MSKKETEKGEMITVLFLMKPGVVTVECNATVLQIAKIMKDKGVRNIFVLKSGKPVGLVRDIDLIDQVVASRTDPATVTAEQVMLTPPPIISSDARLAEIAKLMVDSGVRRILVVDGNKILGTITAGDLLSFVSKIPSSTIHAFYEKLQKSLH